MHDPKVKPEACATPGCTNEVTSYQIGRAVFYTPLCGACQKAIQKEQEEAFWLATKRRSNEEEWRSIGIPPRFFDEDFTTFRVTDGNRSAYDAAVFFANEYRSGKTTGGLVILGGVGVGKTHLACAVLKAARSGLLVTQSDLMADVRAEWQRSSESVVGYRQRCTEASLLVLDDVAAEDLPESQALWLRDTIYRIVNTRWDEKLPTVVTSNSTMHDFERRIGSPAASRLVGGSKVVAIESYDHRIRK